MKDDGFMEELMIILSDASVHNPAVRVAEVMRRIDGLPEVERLPTFTKMLQECYQVLEGDDDFLENWEEAWFGEIDPFKEISIKGLLHPWNARFTVEDIATLWATYTQYGAGNKLGILIITRLIFCTRAPFSLLCDLDFNEIPNNEGDVVEQYNTELNLIAHQHTLPFEDTNERVVLIAKILQGIPNLYDALQVLMLGTPQDITAEFVSEDGEFQVEFVQLEEDEDESE